MTSALSPQQAIVRPRVFTPDTGDVVPLEDALQAWLTKRDPGVALIIGGAGAGKSTALAYLQEVLTDVEHLRLIDDADEAPLPDLASGPPAIWSVSSPETRSPHKLPSYAFRLAPWQQDDWIEYLLAAHPNSCSSVIPRLQQADDRKLLAGNPELCRIVLDRMAADESIRTVREALQQELGELLSDPNLRSVAEDYAVDILTGSSKIRKIVKLLDEFGCGKTAFRLLRHNCIRNMLAARSIVSRLSDGTRAERDCLRRVLPRDLIHEIARHLNQPTRLHLETIQQLRKLEFNPMTVSILVAHDPNWRPAGDHVGPLTGAFVDGVNWSGIDLSRSELNHCEFSTASLDGANFDHSRANSCNFTRSYLHEATAEKSKFARSCFNDAIANGLNAPGAEFDSVEAIACDFGRSQLQKTYFIGANLTNASFRACDLSTADFRRAAVHGVDFSEAQLESAYLNDLDLTNVNLQDACMDSCHLVNCNLEFTDLPDAAFRKANLSNALLTGTRMPHADFEAANLYATGLAEIEWEGANLRDADLRGSTFHMGSSRSGRVDSDLASEGTRTGFYTDDYNEQHFKSPEEIRKANLCSADLRGAKIENVDFYLVDLRGAKYTAEQRQQFEACGAILSNP